MSGTIGSKSSDVPVGSIGTGTVSANSLIVGANVAVNTSTISVGNSTVNTVANSTAFYSSGNAISPYGMRNRIINGGMTVAQRNTTFTVGSSSYTYTLDRFKAYSVNSSTTVSQNTSAPAGFQYSLKLQRTATNTGTNLLSFVQIIETVNCYDLAGQTVTFSFYAKTGANYSGGNIGVQVISGTTADQGGDPYSWSGLATAINTTQTITSTWTRYSFTGTVPSNSLEIAISLSFTPTGTAGADDSVYITGIQLEKGSVATPFENRHFTNELQLCQRYFWRSNPLNTTGAGPAMQSSTYTSCYASSWVSLPVQMRSTPTITQNGSWNTAGPLNLVTFSYVDPTGFIIIVVSTGAGNPIWYPTATGYMSALAEL